MKKRVLSYNCIDVLHFGDFLHAGRCNKFRPR